MDDERSSYGPTVAALKPLTGDLKKKEAVPE
jgi:hypothetical protein